MKNKNKIFLGLILASATTIVSCSKMNDYKDFTKGGEITYAGKIDSVYVNSGKGHVIIHGLFMSDPKITACKIFWNNMKDSTAIPVVRTSSVDSLRADIPLAENLYNFVIYTYDALGNKSVPVYTSGRSYGSLYQASIPNRMVQYTYMDPAIYAGPTGPNCDATLQWRAFDTSTGGFAMIITYTKNNGAVDSIRSTPKDNSVVLPDYKVGTVFKTQTLYLPDTLCVDTFRTDISINKFYTIWASDQQWHDDNGYGQARFVFDSDINTFWHARYNDCSPQDPTNGNWDPAQYPHWLAIDLGSIQKLSGLNITPRQGNNNDRFKEFSVQISSDGVNWTDNASFIQPDNTDMHTFKLPSPVMTRYFRIYMTGHYTGQPYTHMAELVPLFAI